MFNAREKTRQRRSGGQTGLHQRVKGEGDRAGMGRETARVVRLGRRQKSRRWARIGQTLRERSPTRRASTFLSMSEGLRRPRAGGPARQAAKVASLGQDRPNAPRAFADPPSLHFSVNERRGGERDGSSGREAASAKPRCLRHPKTRPACAAATPLLPRPQTAAPAADRPSLKP